MITRVYKLWEGDIKPTKTSTSEIVVDTLVRASSLVSKLSGLPSGVPRNFVRGGVGGFNKFS